MPVDCRGRINFMNTLRRRQNGRHFADDTLNRIFLNKNVRISLKFVRKSPIDNIQALLQIMAWRRPGDKPLSEATMVSLKTHICVARPQCVNATMNKQQRTLLTDDYAYSDNGSANLTNFIWCILHIDDLMQKRQNSVANTRGLRLLSILP